MLRTPGSGEEARHPTHWGPAPLTVKEQSLEWSPASRELGVWSLPALSTNFHLILPAPTSALSPSPKAPEPSPPDLCSLLPQTSSSSAFTSHSLHLLPPSWWQPVRHQSRAPTSHSPADPSLMPHPPLAKASEGLPGAPSWSPHPAHRDLSTTCTTTPPPPPS